MLLRTDPPREYPMKLFKALLAIPLAFAAAPAFAQPLLEDLDFAFPEADSVEAEPVQFVQLHFDAEVDLASVEIGYPDDTKVEIYNAFTDLMPLKKNNVFAITLAQPLTAPGMYNVFYAISMTRENNTTDTNVGSYAFTITIPSSAPAEATERIDDAPGA